MGDTAKEPFPWDLGIFDAHCHPTDTMASIPTMAQTMKARTLTIMATRSQDQALVAAVAMQHGVSSHEAITAAGCDQKVIPSFGWHPWFSHLLYNDSLNSDTATLTTSACDQEAEKRRHYNAVLSPPPNSKRDDDFIERLPAPQSLSSFIAQTRAYLDAHPLGLVGEIGLDKAFRLPSHEPAAEDLSMGMTPGRRDGRGLSPYRVNTDHQIRVLKAQLRLAGELGRAVSVHGVQAPGVLYDTLKSTWKGHEKRVVSKREKKKIARGVNEDFSSDNEDDSGSDIPNTRAKKYKPKPFPPRICLHSFSGTVQTLQQYVEDRSIPAKIYFSFSLLVNYSTGGHDRERRKHVADEVIKACPDDRILLESDLHSAGQEMDHLLEEIYRKVCQVKGWSLHDGVRQIKKNYEEFILG